jgi:hypothetical protein
VFPDAPEDFNDAFGESVDAVAKQSGLNLDPIIWVVIAGLCLLGLAVYLSAKFLGAARARGALRIRQIESAKHIYDAISYHLDEALQAPGAGILEKTKDLKSVIDSRLGLIMALNTRPGKAMAALKKALESKPEEESADKPKKIKVAMSTEEHRIAVWEALHKFKAFWGDKAAILALLTEAQQELSHDDHKRFIMSFEKLHDPEITEKSRFNSPKLSKQTVKAKSDTMTSPDKGPSEPPPTPPAPKGGKTKSDLPKHKKNMLA